MNELLDKVQLALGDAFRVESEMPAGGMSRVFLALEASLNRRVVVKVLPPELASEVSAARFRREAEYLARLQHPHILPILTSGWRGDILYYVMPYVHGESVRHRLEREGAFPVDAVRRAHCAGDPHRTPHDAAAPRGRSPPRGAGRREPGYRAGAVQGTGRSVRERLRSPLADSNRPQNDERYHSTTPRAVRLFALR